MKLQWEIGLKTLKVHQDSLKWGREFQKHWIKKTIILAVDTPIIENGMEEQSPEEIQENQEQVTAPLTNYVTVSGRPSQPQHV